MIIAPAQFAKAMSAAALADFATSPWVLDAVDDGRLDANGLDTLIFDSISGRNDYFPNIKKLVETEIALQASDPKDAGMGQWDDLGKALSAVVSLAVNSSIAKKAADTQTSILKDAQARIVAGQEQLITQAKIEQVAYEQAAQKVQADTGFTPDEMANLKAAGIAVVLVGVGFYFWQKRRGRK